jgi:hypothetical protein
MTPDEAIRAFIRLGCVEVPRHSRHKNYRWLERTDEKGRQIAIFNVPVSKPILAKGTLLNSLLRPNGIRDEAHLQELLADLDPPSAFLKVIPKSGPRYRLPGR